MINQQKTWKKLKGILKNNNISILSRSSLTSEEKKWCSNYFEADILPVLTPLAIDPSHPFPFIGNLGLVLSIQLQHEKTNRQTNALLPLPVILSRFIKIECSSNKNNRGTIQRYSVISPFLQKNQESSR